MIHKPMTSLMQHIQSYGTSVQYTCHTHFMYIMGVAEGPTNNLLFALKNIVIGWSYSLLYNKTSYSCSKAAVLCIKQDKVVAQHLLQLSNHVTFLSYI